MLYAGRDETTGRDLCRCRSKQGGSGTQSWYPSTCEIWSDEERGDGIFQSTSSSSTVTYMRRATRHEAVHMAVCQPQTVSDGGSP